MQTVFNVLIAVLFAGSAIAETTSNIAAGAIVNSWVQSGLRATDKAFDLAIQGHGFFVLRTSNGDMTFSRYGEMGLDRSGYLVHATSQLPVLGYCDDELGPIDLSRFASDPSDSSVAKSFRVELDGKIVAAYANNRVRETCQIALAIFQNPRNLRRGQKHLLDSGIESGDPSIGRPHSNIRGSIYGSALEELDEQLYRSNINDGHADRITQEMAKSRLANESWQKEKTLFYVYDLGLSRQELLAVEKSADDSSKRISRIVALSEQSSAAISAEEFSKQIEAIVAAHESEVLATIGSERLERAKKFRDNFNLNAWSRFGTIVRYTGF